MAIYVVLAAYLVLLAATAAFLVFWTYTLIIAPAKGSPFARTRRGRTDRMLELAGVKPGELLLDLGSGDGSVLIAATRRGARAVGVEINPFFVWYSRWRIRRNGLAHLARVERGDLFNHPIGQADIVFMFLLPRAIEGLRERLSAEAKPGSRIVSHLFPISGWTPQKI